MSKPLPPKYQTINWQTYNHSLKQRGQLLLWLDKDMNWQAQATGRRGRQPTFCDATIQFCLTITCLFGLALRQAIGIVESMLRLSGLDWAAPDFSTPPPKKIPAGAHPGTEETGVSASLGG